METVGSFNCRDPCFHVNSENTDHSLGYLIVFDRPCLSKTKKDSNATRCYLSVGYSNLRSLPAQLVELRYHVEVNAYDIFCVSESWLHEHILDATVNIPGYRLLRGDRRSSMRGGGVAVYVRDHLLISGIDQVCDPQGSFESITFHIGYDRVGISLCVVYRSPSMITDCNLLKSVLRSISISSHFLLLGDFNLPRSDWRQTIFDDGTVVEREISHFLADELLLVQHIQEPTRFSSHNNDTILDLVFSKRLEDIARVDYLPPIGNSDHCVLSLQVTPNFKFRHFTAPIVKRVWSKVLDEQILSFCQRHPLSLTNTKEVSLKVIGDYLLGISDVFAPKRIISPNTKYPVWFDKDLRLMLRVRNRLWKLSRSLPYYANIYRYLRNVCTRMKTLKRDKFESTIIKEVNRNPKLFWSYARQNGTLNSAIKHVHSECGLVTNETDIAETFASSFSLSTLPHCDSHMIWYGCSIPPRNESRPICVTEIQDYLNNIRPFSAAGPDDISPYLLKALSSYLAPFLTIIFDKSLATGSVPEDWKTATVVPIPKKIFASSCGDYRPISLTSSLCKVLERAISTRVYDHLVSLGILSSAQHGFRHSRSCLTNLLTARETWTQSLSFGSSLDIIFIDFSKAFDRVPHDGMIRLLAHYGVSSMLCNWIRDFLDGRSFQVRVGNSMSSTRLVKSGVPQGTVLGPLLFIIFLNDLLLRINSPCLAFADDVKVWCDSISDPDGRHLQHDLQTIYDWSSATGMTINVDKCVHMKLGKCKSDHEFYLGCYKLHNISVHRDLGIILNNDLKTRPNTDYIYGKAMKALYCIKNTFSKLHPKLFKHLYCALVRPHVEYCIASTFPSTKAEMKKTESILRRGTKLCITSLYSYNERLACLKMPSTAQRLLYLDLVAMWHLVRGKEGFPSNSIKLRNSRRRGHSLTLFKFPHGKIRSVSRLSHRALNVWNSLPEDVVNATSNRHFKKMLLKWIVNSNLDSWMYFN